MIEKRNLQVELDRILSQAIERRIATSCSLFVGFGHEDSPHDIEMHKGSLGAEVIYDLASITKIIGTTLGIARAISEGRIGLKTAPLLGWPQITIGMLLAHRAGLKAHCHYYDELALSSHNFAHNRRLIFDRLLSMPAVPNSDRVYSDLGFMALGLVLERLYGQPLFNIFSDTWRKFKIDAQFSWHPSKSGMGDASLNAPTGHCHARKQRIVNAVHDANCYFLGGLAGHAGLFGSLANLKIMGQWLLRAAISPRHEPEAIVKEMARRALGFDKPSLHGSTRDFSHAAFGHFGYTGTSLWIDPKSHGSRGVVIALLTNRVHCGEDPDNILWLRLAVHRAVKNHSQNASSRGGVRGIQRTANNLDPADFAAG